MTVYRDLYAATHFEPGCAHCDDLWRQLLEANKLPDWQERVQVVTGRVRAHAREEHQLELAPDSGAAAPSGFTARAGERG
jgi:hypothetical protein